jgi:hypothetical protein
VVTILDEVPCPNTFECDRHFQIWLAACNDGVSQEMVHLQPDTSRALDSSLEVGET